MSRIAFVSTNAIERWGGSEELWGQTAAKLVRSGVQVSITTQWCEPILPQVKDLMDLGCRAYFRNAPSSALRRLHTKFMPGRFRHKIWPEQKYRWLDEERPDLVVVAQCTHLDGGEYMQACAERSIPYVTIAQAAFEGWWPFDEPIAQLSNLFEQALACYFVSEANLKLTRIQLASPLKNAAVVRNPYNVPYDVNLAWPESDTGFRLACVGRLEPCSKGQDILFDVLAQEKWKQRPLSVTLFGSGLNAQNLRALAKMYALENVTFGGFVANIEEIWAAHHALILPSRYEGLPLAVVEAMLCARPCIVTDVAGNTELVEDEAQGFVAAAPMPKFVDEALERAWRRRQEWQAIGQAAALKARQCVSADPIHDFTNMLICLLSAQEGQAKA